MNTLFSTLLLASSATAFLLAILGIWRPIGRWVEKFYAWIPLPALILGIASVVRSDLGVSEYPDLLLGMRIGLDEVGRAFLILTSLIWVIAGLYSRNYFPKEEQRRFFRFFFLVTYSGNIGLTIAQDAPTFYAGYALMTLGGYGLITQTHKMAARVAGRVYFVVAFFGEMMTLAGLIIAASESQTFALQDIAESIRTSHFGPLSFWLIFVGFGTKVGLVPLHFWLPRSYYWAPLPAVALLSGAMTKAGILGWLRFLRLPESSVAPEIIIGAGALMAFYGVFFGIVQTRAKTTLAFSSLSQMGYLTMAVATVLEAPATNGKSIAATIAYAFHHGLTKVALFLGLGLLVNCAYGSTARKFVFICLSICSLTLIGLPFTSGAYAKALLKGAGAPEGTWHSIAGPLLTLGSIGTALLMARFLVLCFRGEHDQVQPSSNWFSRWLSGGASFALVFGGAWLLPETLASLNLKATPALSIGESVKAFFPVAIGSVIALVATFKLWLKRSVLTPRPFDTILQGAYKAVWEDFPREVDHFVLKITHLPIRFRVRLALETSGKKALSTAESLHTSWFLGCAFFLSIGVLLWTFLKAGRPW